MNKPIIKLCEYYASYFSNLFSRNEWWCKQLTILVDNTETKIDQVNSLLKQLDIEPRSALSSQSSSNKNQVKSCQNTLKIVMK